MRAHIVAPATREGEFPLVISVITSGFLNLRFSSSDALRRHWQTCTERISAGDEIPRRTPSGKRKQVCDSCTSRKRACSTGQPCSECSTRGTECTYHGVQRARPEGTRCTDPARAQSVASEQNLGLRKNTRHPDDEESNLCRVSRSRCPRLDFLINFTRATGLNAAYNYNGGNTLSSETETCSDDQSTLEVSYCGTAASNPFVCYLDDVESALFGDISASAAVHPSLVHLEEMISEKTTFLWNSLQNSSNSFTNDRSHISIHEWLSFFSPVNLNRYLSLFWDRWHRHCPIVHQATFELSDCSPLLLATMALLGACMSSLRLDQQAARGMLDAVEELLFSHSLFSESSILGLKSQNQFPSREQLQVLQAACFMCLLQKWEGSAEAKLRIQRKRFTTFVAVAIQNHRCRYTGLTWNR